ncbi:MAG: RnfABCDGE type electron transport complex subunit D [Clostridia bacterium]|nr:RnfABCDGE type electron transport complex subunit D [Clostridia bacterium]
MSLRISTAPHMHNPLTTSRLMQNVVIALMPTVLVGVYAFGFPALLVLAVSVASAVLSEFLWQKIARQPVRINDFSAILTGLILGLNLPSTAPWWMAMIGSAFAIIIVKQLFGGLGDNFLNPALAARAVLLASWPVHMAASAYVAPTFFEAGVDAVSAATPLSSPGSYTLMQRLLGQIPGTIGEVSKIAILIGFLFLVFTSTISWRIPVIMVGSVYVFTLLIVGEGFESALIATLSGGVLFGAVFMATDYVTSPIRPVAQIIYAVLIGLIIVLIRQFGNYPEGVTYGILLMNIATPLIDRFLPQKIYGYQKKEAKKA